MEKVHVHAEIGWGRKFNGSYNAETKGEGCYVTVMQYRGPENDYGRAEASFRGCPLGSGQSVSEAVRDFVLRGKHEYQGKEPLAYDMIVVIKTSDYRK